MSIAGNEIKRIAESLGMIFFRSININDLNIQVGETDLQGQTLCVYANTPTISNETYPQASAILQQYQVEIYFLQLNFYTDDTGTQIDTILDATNTLANSFFDELKRSPIIQGFIQDYELEAVETIKMTKEVLSGWQMTVTLPIPRTEFYCPPPE